jgi:NADH-quinone oxidoreductase subunit N
MDVVILLGTIGALALAIDDNDRLGTTTAETHVLILLASSGMMLLAAARDLMIVFLGIELMSISVYALAGINRRSERSAEGALKYFLLGAFSTAFLLYGIALVYGATGTTGLHEIRMRVAEHGLSGNPLLLIGIAMLLVGFGFKISTVPFHMWAPDVYDGAPNPITAYMAATVKTAAFAAFLRVWLEAFAGEFGVWHRAVAGLAIASMVVGNLVALAQRSLKRMLAYSSVAHAGYLLVAVWPGTPNGAGAVMLYLLAYGLTTFASFGYLAVLGRGGERDVTYDDIAGLAASRPWVAAGLSICMLSLLGFPGTLGFIGKWYILNAVVAQNHAALAVILVLTSVVSAGYYLPVVMAMYMKPAPARELQPGTRLWPPAAGVVAVAVVAVLVFGFWPQPVLQLAGDTGQTLTQTAIPMAGP